MILNHKVAILILLLAICIIVIIISQCSTQTKLLYETKKIPHEELFNQQTRANAFEFQMMARCNGFNKLRDIYKKERLIKDEYEILLERFTGNWSQGYMGVYIVVERRGCKAHIAAMNDDPFIIYIDNNTCERLRILITTTLKQGQISEDYCIDCGYDYLYLTKDSDHIESVYKPIKTLEECNDGCYTTECEEECMIKIEWSNMLEELLGRKRYLELLTNKGYCKGTIANDNMNQDMQNTND
ncbi:MAG TPA: hypothetical protein PKH33_01330 [bacterium]|nr:hypothetical protein [bacterium]